MSHPKMTIEVVQKPLSTGVNPVASFDGALNGRPVFLWLGTLAVRSREDPEVIANLAVIGLSLLIQELTFLLHGFARPAET